jgi:hypothetical protein
MAHACNTAENKWGRPFISKRGTNDNDGVRPDFYKMNVASTDFLPRAARSSCGYAVLPVPGGLFVVR